MTMTPPLLGITERHPWAFCIARLGKTIENRSQHPRQKGGQVGMYLAIHGGVVPKGEVLEEAQHDIRYLLRSVIAEPDPGNPPVYREDWWDELTPEQAAWIEANPVTAASFFAPGIVALARLSAVTSGGVAGNRWSAHSGYQWHLADVTPLETPLPYRGAQGLWKIDDPLTMDRLKATWAAAHDGEVPF
jgi:hypothetical protein